MSKRKRAILCGIALLLIAYYFCLPKQIFNVPYSTVVTDKNGELLGARIAKDGQWRFPPADSVPDKFVTCLTNYEDQYFKYHWGVNPLAIGRAVKQNMQSKRIVSGGSTITMQTIRLSRGEKRTYGEKLWEAILATRLEFRCSKQQIISLYAAHAPFGGNVVGLEAASWRYFGHTSHQLSWAEAATLAVLPNAPSMIHLAKNRDRLKTKRDELLKTLHQRDVISETDYELALSENLPAEPLPLPQIAPHLVTYFYQNKPGKETHSTIDKGIQQQVEDLLERWNAEFAKSDIRNIAAIVIDVQTNKVITYCGNVRFQKNTSSNQVDIIRSPRSTGSILKPFLYYVTLQEGEILPNTLLPDIPMNVNGFAPQNFNHQYDGAVPAAEAISRSLNIPTVYLLREYSVPKFYDFLKDAGMKTLTKRASHYGLSLILGGAEGTLWDISGIYSNMGRSISGADRTELLIDEDEKEKKLPPLFHRGAAWQTFSAITDLNRPEDIDWRTIPSMQTVAWKTGTSYGFRDAWAIGVTPKYVVGVWVGNASGEGKPELIGARTAGPVMFDILNILPSSSWFDRPTEEFTEVEVCHISGCLKGRFCDVVDTILICPNGQKTTFCPYHIPVYLTPDERFRVYANCVGNEPIITKNWFVLPPAREWYYKKKHPEYQSLPPFKAGCGSGDQSPMQFIYPQGNTRISLPKQLDGQRGDVTFELAHNQSDAIVFWHLDNEYIATTQDFHKISLQPSLGRHSITVVDQDGHTLSISVVFE